MFNLKSRVGVAVAVACAVAGISASSAMAKADPILISAPLDKSETVGGETFNYKATCVAGPGVATSGPPSPTKYVFSLEGSASSSNAADPAISTSGACDVHYLGGGPIGEFGRTLIGPSTVAVGPIDIDTRYQIQICVTVGAGFLNGHIGSQTQCTTPW